jgi:hypothetical protein
VLIRVHDNHITRDFAVAANDDSLGCHYFDPTIQVRTISNSDQRTLPAFESHSGEESAVLDLNPPSILHRWQWESYNCDNDSSALESLSQPETQDMTRNAALA